MTSLPLSRNTYTDPFQANHPPRAGNTAHSESAIDMDQYYRALDVSMRPASMDLAFAPG